MSNQLVGTVYQQIINEVIETSRVDFEEFGVDEGVLEELRKGWQNKLTNLKVAAFPWDPPSAPAPAPAPPAVPTPVTAPAAPATQAQQVHQPSYTQATLSPSTNAQPLPVPVAANAPGLPNQNGNAPAQMKSQNLVRNEPVVKQEPGLANGVAPAAHPPVPPHYGAPGNVAAQRAAAQLQNQYGSRAAASISAIQQGNYGQASQAQGQQLGRAGTPNQPPRPGVPLQQQQQNAPQQMQQRPQVPGPRPQPQPPHLGQSQVDGAADTYDGVLMEKGANGELSELGRVGIDTMLHEQIAAHAKRMEGGGFMLPLKQALKHAGSAKKLNTEITQFDGIDDEIKKEEGVDEDAINSDLDDPDDVDPADDDDDDNMGHIMLCMYDKVQRVKNKWKCTLKDGVLTVNGKEYVFHKATGEYEW